MSIRKRYLKSKPCCKVTFRLPQKRTNEIEEACVVGEFNQWSTEATPMKKMKNGNFQVTVDLDSGREYQFRYLIDGHFWQNDEQADKRIPNNYSGDDNSVVTL